MSTYLEAKFQEWTCGKNSRDARIAIFNRIRDIPYAVIPELNDPRLYTKMLDFNRGSCTPKHFLLCTMFQMLSLPVLYVVYRYKWEEFDNLYPPELGKLAREIPQVNHLACKVEIEGKLVLVDATLDPALSLLGLPVNKRWNGLDDTLLAIEPRDKEQIYHPSEAELMQPQQADRAAKPFYDSLNLWLESVRLKSNLISK